MQISVMKACLLFTAAAAGLLAQDLPRASAEYGSFALPDPTGARLIAVGGIPDAENVHQAFCGGSASLPVRFDHKQAGRKENNGRQTPSRFNDLPGDVFHMVAGSAGATASCFLAGSRWTPDATLLRIDSREHGANCGATVQEHLAAVKGRAVVRCFLLGRFEDDGQVLLAEFARIGNDALASVVVRSGDRLMFGDYTAEFRGEGQDLWRVDDGGKLSAEGFDLIFLASQRGQYDLGVSWAATEGRALTLFVSGDGSRLDRVLQDYWYQMPE